MTPVKKLIMDFMLFSPLKPLFRLTFSALQKGKAFRFLISSTLLPAVMGISKIEPLL
jgi:hypothetical protein